MLTHNRCTLGLNTIYGIMYFFSFITFADEVTHVDEMYINRWISKGPGYIIMGNMRNGDSVSTFEKIQKFLMLPFNFRKLIVFNSCVQSMLVRVLVDRENCRTNCEKL